MLTPPSAFIGRACAFIGWVRLEKSSKISARALEVLNVLIEQQPEAVSKRALIERVWKNGTLGNVDVQIKNLRRVLEKGATQPGCIIQNVPRRALPVCRKTDFANGRRPTTPAIGDGP